LVEALDSLTNNFKANPVLVFEQVNGEVLLFLLIIRARGRSEALSTKRVKFRVKTAGFALAKFAPFCELRLATFSEDEREVF
jgi:hypothetical protein